MKKNAEVVIIGGGVIGTAIAYNLACLGVEDVVLVERDTLASGATGCCAGGIRQQWSETIAKKLHTLVWISVAAVVVSWQ